MAKARPVPGVDAGSSFAAAAAGTLTLRTREVFEHTRGVLDTSDVERVHDMRVATRRLRAALDLYAPCLPRKRRKRVRREVKRLARALGERRDPDVALERVDALAAAHPHEQRALERLRAELRDEQLAANAALERALAAARDSQLQRRLLELARKSSPKRPATGGVDPAAPLRDNLRLLAGQRVCELEALVPRALDPAEIEVQHELRITAKRLRYALELAEPAGGTPGKRAIKACRRVQDLLGDVRDRDALIERARRHPGLERTIAHLAAERAVDFECFVREWDDLLDRLAAGAATPTDRRAAAPAPAARAGGGAA